MRKASKIALFILGLCTALYIGFSAWYLYWMLQYDVWPYQPDPFGTYQEMAVFYGLAALAVIAMCTALGLMLRGLLARRRDRTLTFSDAAGTIEMTEDALHASVHTALQQYPSIVDQHIRVHMTGKKTPLITLRVRCGITAGQDLDQFGQVIRERLRSDLERLTGVAVATVDVTFYEAKPAHRADTARR